MERCSRRAHDATVSGLVPEAECEHETARTCGRFVYSAAGLTEQAGCSPATLQTGRARTNRPTFLALPVFAPEKKPLGAGGRITSPFLVSHPFRAYLAPAPF